MNTLKILLSIIAAAITIAFSSSGVSAQWGISPDQREQLRKLMENSRRENLTARLSLMEKHKQLARLYGEYNLKVADAKALNKDINEIQLKLLQINLESQTGIRRILNREQFEKFGQSLRRPKPNRRFGEDFDHEKGLNVHPGDLEPLGLTDQQRQSLKRLWERRGDSPLVAARKIREKSAELQSLYENYDLDSRKAAVLVREINNAQMELLESKLRTQTELRRILTEEQFNRMKESISEKTKKRFEKPGPHRPWPKNKPHGR